MKSIAAAAGVAAVSLTLAAPLTAQVGTPANPMVGTPVTSSPIQSPPDRAESVDMPAPVSRGGPLPAQLTLPQALEEAAARSPTVVAAEREVAAAQARLLQAGYRNNPELSVQLEDFAGTGQLKGMRRTQTTVAVNQRLDISGRRPARIEVGRAQLFVQQLRLAIARADLAQSVRDQFARAVAARERLNQVVDNERWARELARVAGVLVEAGREPPLRAIRARSALAQASAAREAAEADELAARSSLAALFGVSDPVQQVAGAALDLAPHQVAPERSLEVRLANAERAAAQASVSQQLVERRLDPAVGVGVRNIRETGDVALVAGISMPLRVFDRNRGNIAAARAVEAANEARQASVLATTRARARNAIVTVEAAQRRVAALEKSAVPEASEALRLAQRSYEEGRASLLELLDARNSYTAAQAQLTEARLALAIATAELGRISAQ